MRKLNVFIFVLLTALYVNGQTTKNVEDGQLLAGILLPGVAYEFGVAKNTTVMAEATVGGFARGCSDCETRYGIFPIFKGQVKQYVNMSRRLSKRKRIAGNSGNYVGLTTVYQSGQPFIGNADLVASAYSVGPIYGLQRTLPKGFNFRLEAGAGYYRNGLGRQGIDLLLAAKIGWVIWKVKSK